ncbi:hypothetical protein FJZ48_01755 [Candidatus Uhrbacteria bacterium]|nr:hypothetical protein [Candidatus Uhrbacteria bacterium]
MIRQIYITGPTTSAPGKVQARWFYDRLAKVARGHGWRSYIPRPVTPEEHHAGITEFDLYQQDSLILKASHLVIVEVTEPSSKVRSEISIALASNLRIIALVGPERSTSRFTIDFLEQKGALVLHYKDEPHALELVSQTLGSLTLNLRLTERTSNTILQSQ